MRAVAPSLRIIQEAFRMGQTLAMSDPNFLPQLEDAAQHPNYVLFMLHHRKKLEAIPRFWTWDLRLEDMIEDEAESKGLPLTPENAEVVLRTFATPIRCAFWYGWESTQNLHMRYEQATGNRNSAPATRVLSADLASIQAAAQDIDLPRPAMSAEEAVAAGQAVQGSPSCQSPSMP